MTQEALGGSERLSPAEQQDLVQAFAASVVEEVAPDEMAVFDETAEEYFADPGAVLDPRRRDEAVGFGIDVALLTPVVLAVVGQVVEFLAGVVVQVTGESVKPALVRMLRRLLRLEKTEDAGPPPLTREQLGRVREIAFGRACDLGLTPEQARLLADSVAGGVQVRS